MSFKIASSPHQHNQRSTAQIMRLVALACIPGIIVQAIFFGYGVLVQLLLAIITAWLSEALVFILRKKPVLARLKDNSAMLTAILLAIAIPPYAPWWIIVIGSAFAIIVVKQLYGGLGNNVFNPAMAAYVLLLISFPVQMTQWLPPQSLSAYPLTPIDAICSIFTSFSCSGFSLAQLQTSVDGITLATPLDTLRTQLSQGFTLSESLEKPVFYAFAGTGWLWVSVAYLAGGLFLLSQKVINWRIPVSILVSIFVFSSLFSLLNPDSSAGPLFHLFTGATMFAAFFIATDPVSASTTMKGRLIYGALIGLLVCVIRNFGGYPDAYAFAILLANMAVPFIDYYTRPRTYGHGLSKEQK